MLLLSSSSTFFFPYFSIFLLLFIKNELILEFMVNIGEPTEITYKSKEEMEIWCHVGGKVLDVWDLDNGLLVKIFAFFCFIDSSRAMKDGYVKFKSRSWDLVVSYITRL